MFAALVLTACASACVASLVTAVVIRRRARGYTAAITDEQILAHEIRTPLSLIKGAAELLGQETDPRKCERLAATIGANSTRAIEVAESFLLQAKLNSGSLTLQVSQCDVRGLVRSTAQELRAMSEVPIVVDDPGDPLMIDGDPQLLRHALWNVLNNAARYAGSDSDIVVGVEESSTGVIVTVADYGPGMTARQRQNMFVPFAQFGQEQSQGQGPVGVPSGAGLGMAITQKIVQLHRGSVLVDSIADHGTSVLITLPKNYHA
ncbi:sensor histidine kinase [Corynebacterium pseudotuberculosis]|uniref:sensor histidine kinase n=1 Tax=Corynebacterium pseudotuberculosis TaxID=1719 RepID=UPI0002660E7D|nr:HAMP domain-containing sensor histidine kinase [Corynebacterium pseudotuberculosis]AFM06561.1 sensor histidine kinase [Corynebacterium pseudotuberculosis Cp162]APG80915.1 Sensor-like histidine kinase [Corynebacterium pseudotuberculosis]WFP67394.1 HAMP domain-containing sensor histidine kinase [Corynebacterium pseudotuberculosis]